MNSLDALFLRGAEHLLLLTDRDSTVFPRDKFPLNELSLTLFELNIVLNPAKSEILETSLDVGLVF
jgi:hypothetical protein